MNIDWRPFDKRSHNAMWGLFWVQLIILKGTEVIYDGEDGIDIAILMQNPETDVYFLACINGFDGRTLFILTDWEKWTLAVRPDSPNSSRTTIDPLESQAMWDQVTTFGTSPTEADRDKIRMHASLLQ